MSICNGLTTTSLFSMYNRPTTFLWTLLLMYFCLYIVQLCATVTRSISATCLLITRPYFWALRDHDWGL